MKNLRVSSFIAVDSTSLKVVFTEPLNPDIDVANIQISSESAGVADPRILSVAVADNVLTIGTQPLTALAVYYVSFVSTSDVPFTSLNADARLLEDGISNKQFLLGPFEETNAVKDYFLNYLRDNVYNTDSGTLINNYLDTISNFFSTALYDARQLRNENYLSYTVTDEQRTRGNGGFDRLDQEGAYEVIRVAKTQTAASTIKKISVDSFTRDPITLLQANFNENLILNSTDVLGSFNLNSFRLNLSHKFVTQLLSLTFTYSNGHLPYQYDIDKYGYQILDSKYNKTVGFTYLQLADNQIRLNDKILEDPNFSLESVFQLQTTYQYKDRGRVLDSTTLSVNSVSASGREVLPPLVNIFNLKHGPVVDSNNNIGTVGDVQFVNQNTLSVLNTLHSAFLTEIVFRLELLPSAPGEYSIDYNTGTVYVFGATVDNDGTGGTPPLAIYNYRLNYKENLDWILDETDLVALPNGNLIDTPATITFDYEQVLAPDVDYKAVIHKESPQERIDNNLVALNALTVENAPITDVFRIFNESTGEVYTPIRWFNNKIYFTYLNPPNIQEFDGERASFQQVNNEVLFVDSISDITGGLKLFTILLNNNRIVGRSEDCIGSVFNTTISFSNNQLFQQELYFDQALEIVENLSRLQIAGQYLVDYTNGVIYLVAAGDNDFNMGAVSYKNSHIAPTSPHITSVTDLYYRVNTLGNKDKSFEYESFDDGFILPKTLDVANEQFLNGNSTAPYLLSDSQVGAVVDGEFVPTVSSRIRFLRAIYEQSDLLNNSTPLNFSATATFMDKSITVAPLVFTEYHSVQYDGTHYFISLNTPLQSLSANIQFTAQVIRLGDSQNLWDDSGTLQFGMPLKLRLSGANSPQPNDSVMVTYTYQLQDGSHIIVDYNKGEYYIDYNALVDEIIVSYEYGDNVLDFRETAAITAGENYFVTYKVGALRGALLKNFGSLIDIDLLNVFDTTFDRERYRDALMAALHSFSKGPTIAAMETLVQTITHVPGKVDEYAFEGWSLGSSTLHPSAFKTTNLTASSLSPSGVTIDRVGQELRLPAVSNLKLESGTFETWVTPGWNGLDNLADLTIYAAKDGYALSSLEIFIGALEYHPILETDYSNGTKYFRLSKEASVIGIPNKHKDGLYIYYAADGYHNRWFAEIIDGYNNDDFSDGYQNKAYTLKILTNGKFYDIKSTTLPQPSSSRITSGTNRLNFNVSSVFPNQGVSFIADTPHYLLDLGEAANRNRLSIFKDESGYLNFKVFDRLKNSYTVSANVSNWRHGDPHHIAASWKINTVMGRDELHLFVDGAEVPNILHYGGRPNPYLHEKFRTVGQEEVVGVISANLVAANDLVTTAGSSQVSSSLNFSQYGIEVGGILYIEEEGFSDAGYAITNVNGNVLTLASTLPFSITDGTFSINKVDISVGTEIDLYPNFTVSLLHSFVQGIDLATISNNAAVTSTGVNFITDGVIPGDLIRINDSAFEKHYTVFSVAAHSLILSDLMPATASSLSFNLYRPNLEEEIPGLRALNPAYRLSQSTDGYHINILTLRDKGEVNDLVLIRTLGMNHRRIRHRYYLWGDDSNLLRTRLPSPMSLDETNIYKVVLPARYIGVEETVRPTQPSNSITGRSLFITLKDLEDRDIIDSMNPLNVFIDGDIIDADGNITTGWEETVSFSELGSKQTAFLYTNITGVAINTPSGSGDDKASLVEIREFYSLTEVENPGFITNSSTLIPQAEVQYSYQIGAGNSLSSDGILTDGYYTVVDNNQIFSDALVGNNLVILYPPAATGNYKIVGVEDGRKSLFVHNDPFNAPLASFSDGYYQVLNITDYRTGLQNGFFLFEEKGAPGQSYTLSAGVYELDYYTYLSVPLDLSDNDMWVGGSSFDSNQQWGGAIQDIYLLNTLLTDTRAGETAASSQRTITKDFNSVKPPINDITTLINAPLDIVPPINQADIYTFADGTIHQSGNVINDKFTQSILLTDKPLIIDNMGILDTRKAATVEFWVNPIFDTANDPHYRFYFDADGSVTESVVSTHNTIIDLKGAASQVLGVTLPNNVRNYFAGGELINSGKRLLLHQALPNQNTKVIVHYVPKGLKGDRISLYKDPSGYLNFNIRANGTDYQIRSPIFWIRNSWHRVKFSYQLNGGNAMDEMHLLIDGYERGNLVFGQNLLFGQGVVAGSSTIGENFARYNIRFSDPVNQFVVGANSSFNQPAHCLIDNLRVSDIARPLYRPYGEPLDPNYSSNTQMVFPITEDLNTTLLLNFNTLVVKNTDFALLNNDSSLSDFSVNVYDSLDIVGSSLRVKEVLETLIKAFKPATSRAFIQYD